MPSSFLAYIAAEQSRVNSILEAEISKLHLLVQPVLRHVLLDGGKRVRPVLASLSFKLNSKGLEAREFEASACAKLSVALEFLHGASLLHDDIVDGAELRRGKPSAHKQFGLGIVVLAGDILLAKSVQLIADIGRPELSSIFARAITETAVGEIAELNILGNINLQNEEYLQIITGKTAWLLRASCELGAMLAQAEPSAVQAMAEYGHNLGMAFQMVDDALDFSPSSKDTGKPVGGDLREGKLTPPIRSYYEALDPQAQEHFASKFSAKSFNEQDISEIGQAIRTLGFAENTRALASYYLSMAQNSLASLPQAKQKQQEYSFLLAFLEYVRNRKA